MKRQQELQKQVENIQQENQQKNKQENEMQQPNEKIQEKQKQLREKLAKEEKLSGRPYLIAKPTVEQLLKERSALLKPPSSPSPTPPLTTGSRPTPHPSTPPSPR